MNVCFLINGLGPAGAETLLLDIIRHTDADTDIDYTVCFLEGEDTLVPDLEAAGARVVDFDAAFKFDPRALWRLARFFRREEFDILHAHLPYSQTLGRVFGQLGGQKTIVSTQHDFPYKYHPITRTLERVTRPLDAATVAVSQSVERAFTGKSHLYPDHDKKWCTIYNGTDVDSFAKNVRQADKSTVRRQLDLGDSLVFLNVGRYIPHKGQDTLVHAMANVAEEYPDATLLVVGWGPLEDELRQTAADLGIAENVRITGQSTNIEKYYAAADGFVLSSHSESFGIVLLEAMAAELPVVATDIPGPNEVVVDDETGILVPQESSDALSNGMFTLTAEATRKRFGRNGYTRVMEEFDIEQTVSLYRQLYEQLSENSD